MNIRYLRMTAALALLAALSGCSIVDGVQTRASTAETCELTVEILADMSEVTLLLATNPFGYDSYAAELKSLSSDLDALDPRDPELEDAVEGLASEISGLIDGLEEGSSIDEIAESVAGAQLSFIKISDFCESSLAG